MFSKMLLSTCLIFFFAMPFSNALIFADFERFDVFSLKKNVDLTCNWIEGTRCPDYTLTYYYTCCSAVQNQCCFYLQNWTFLVAGLILLIFVISIFCRILRRLLGHSK